MQKSAKTGFPLDIDARAKQLLKTLIERYIADGQPVASRVLAKESGIKLSSATVRNIMVDLEEVGLVVSPHTSAGRIPTSAGLRFFVEALLEVRPGVMTSTKHQLKVLSKTSDPLHSALQTLSQLTHLAGFIRAPARSASALQQVEFIPMEGDRVLVVLVTDSGQVENRIIRLNKPIDHEVLQKSAREINSRYSGMSLTEMAQTLKEEMKSARREIDRVLSELLTLAAIDENGVMVDGELNLLDNPDAGDLDQLRELIGVFRQKQKLLNILEKSMEAEGVRVFIGEDSGLSTLTNASVITAPYTAEGKVIGVIGVIGPKRIRYEEVVSIVDCTAQFLSDSFTHLRN